MLASVITITMIGGRYECVLLEVRPNKFKEDVMTVKIFHYSRRCWLGTSPLFRGVSYSSDGSLAIVLDIVLSHNDCFHENSSIHPTRQSIDDHDGGCQKELTLILAQREPGWSVE